MPYGGIDNYNTVFKGVSVPRIRTPPPPPTPYDIKFMSFSLKHIMIVFAEDGTFVTDKFVKNCTNYAGEGKTTYCMVAKIESRGKYYRHDRQTDIIIIFY